MQAAAAYGLTFHCDPMTGFLDRPAEDLPALLALLRRIARNLAARRTPTSVVNALGQATSGASSAQLDAEISRLEAPHRKAGFA